MDSWRVTGHSFWGGFPAQDKYQGKIQPGYQLESVKVSFDAVLVNKS
jgi:hypothetical protein